MIKCQFCVSRSLSINIHRKRLLARNKRATFIAFLLSVLFVLLVRRSKVLHFVSLFMPSNSFDTSFKQHLYHIMSCSISDSRDSNSHYSGANTNGESGDKSPKLRNFRSRANSSSSINTAISGSSVSSMISVSSSRRSHWPFGK